MFSSKFSDYRDSNASGEDEDFFVEYFSTAALILNEISMEKIELIVAQN